MAEKSRHRLFLRNSVSLKIFFCSLVPLYLQHLRIAWLISNSLLVSTPAPPFVYNVFLMFLPCSIYKTELGNSSMFIKRHGPPSSITVIFLDFMCNCWLILLWLSTRSHYLLKRVAHSYRFLGHPLLFLLPFTSLTSPSSFSNPFYLT